MPLLDLPNELLLDIAEALNQQDLYSLLTVNRLFSSLLIPTLDRFAILDHTTYNSKTYCALHWAVKKNHIPLIQKLVTKGFTTDCRECSASGGETTLHLAAWQGQESVVRLLLDHGAEVDAQNKHGRTALHLATLRAHEGVVRLLLERGADVNLRDLSGRATLILWAMKDSKFWNITAERNGSVFLLLLEYGARIDAKEKNHNGWSALREAVGRGQKDIIKLLMERSVGTEAKCTQAGGPDEWTLRLGRNVEVIKLLQEEGFITVPEVQSTEERQAEQRPRRWRDGVWKSKLRALCRITASSGTFSFGPRSASS